MEIKNPLNPHGEFRYKNLKVSWAIQHSKIILTDKERNRGIGFANLDYFCIFHYGDMFGYDKQSFEQIHIGRFSYVEDDFETASITLPDRTKITANPLEFMCDRYITEILG